MSSKILIVEDDHLLLQLYQTKLQQAGYQVAVASNGQEGYQQALKFSPDLIILDILMPILDGYAMLRLLRQHEQTSSTPVIVLTNSPSIPPAREAQTLGIITSFFKTDITPSQLVAYIQQYFKKQTA